MQTIVLFVVASCCVSIALGAPVLREKTLAYQSGSSAAPNWKGSLYCPMDYGITIETIWIAKPCPGSHCSKLVTYKPANAGDIETKCTGRNTCDIKIWQKSHTDGSDIVINYSCRSLLLLDLFPKKMVKRVYSDKEVSVTTYCNQGRVRRGSHYISRDPPRYTFDDAVAARDILARARVKGFTVEDLKPTESNVFRKIIRRTRPHTDGNNITLPVYLAANLTKTRRSAERVRFPKYVNDYLDQCGIRRGDNPDDGGYLVAYTLGGGDNPTNLVPMARDLNRPQGIWYRHEKEIRDFLEGHPAGMVSWEVLVVYSVKSVEPFRPVGFALRYTTYEDIHNLNNGAARLETFINENEHYRNDQCTFHLEDFFVPETL